MTHETWATFSLGDHLRRRAFVAEVLLYDRLVVPVPADQTNAERHWSQMGWRPDLQSDKLDAIERRLGRSTVIRVPWTEHHQACWQELDESVHRRASYRTDVAVKTRNDAIRVGYARTDVPKSRRGLPEEIDRQAHQCARIVLRDRISRDVRYFAGLPVSTNVDTVVAYGSYRQFQNDYPTKTIADPRGDGPTLSVFGWRLLVPSDSRCSDAELLEDALELAAQEETIEYRRVMHRWIGGIRAGTHDASIADEIGDAVDSYRRAARRLRFLKRTCFAFNAMLVATPSIALIPGLQIPAAFGESAAALGNWAVSGLAKDKAEELAQNKVGLTFHTWRKHFGW